ncbi:MAG: peptidoglycan DD-metalloendopeptidase family protein [Oscillospiraceae bacterium]|jgi:murein DD-endopeptidase MepM/ murein hydrolase activator NlpD|nr:peptidoglycan DD-metalloendopeptidase family protein [Oscillospiraceae bacterium]
MRRKICGPKPAGAFRRALCALLAAVLLAGSLPLPSSAELSQAELEQERAKTEERIAQREAELKSLAKDKANQEKRIDLLAGQIADMDAKAKLLDQSVASLDKSIRQLTARIENLQGEIADCEHRIAEIRKQKADKDAVIQRMQVELMGRLRNQYMDGPASNLQLLLDSDDLTSFLTMAEYISKVAARDQELRLALEQEMADLMVLEAQENQQKSALNEKLEQVRVDSAELEQQKKAVQADKAELQKEYDKLSQTQREIQTILDSLDKKSAAVERLLAADRKAEQEFEARINALIWAKQKEQSAKGGPSAKGEMIWPVQYANCYISDYFGAPRETGTPHKGLDISAPGANDKTYYITCALEGEVIDTGFERSMGNYIVIYNGLYSPKGKEITTTYMHFRSIDSAVRKGAVVSQGQRLGVMGTTGRSTGTHLHFQIGELSSSGGVTYVDPLKYIQNPYK